MKERKKELRRRIAVLKSQYLLADEYQLQSDKVLATLEAHPAFKVASTVLLYYSLRDEVDTHRFVRKWSNKKRILLPVVSGNDLELRLFTGEKDLTIGAYNIEEPTGEPFTNYSEIDFAVIPGVAFDASGQRLGRGKGYYDRLLPRLTAFKAGLCFPFQMVDEVPAEPFDIRMDAVITTCQ